MTVYIVTKNKILDTNIESQNTQINISHNESLFDAEEKAHQYIQMRLNQKDINDQGYTFEIEPWQVY